MTRGLARLSDPQSPLPSFLQNHMNTRSTLNTYNEKCLRENNFYVGKFQTLQSTFNTRNATRSAYGTGSKFLNKKKELSPFDIDDSDKDSYVL